MESFESVEKSLKTHLPDDEYQQVRRILYGKDCKELTCVEAEKLAAQHNFEFKAYSMVHNTNEEQMRPRNLVKIGLIQVSCQGRTSNNDFRTLFMLKHLLQFRSNSLLFGLALRK